MSQKVCLRYTEESTPDLGGRQYVHGTYEKHIQTFTTQAPYIRDTEVVHRLSESPVPIFTVKTES